MTDEEIHLFDASVRRCLEGGDFFGRFYELFLGSNPEVAAKFEATDMQKQRSVIKMSIFHLVAAVRGEAEGIEHLQGIAESHNRSGHDIPPAFYDLWLDCLVKSAGEFDPSFDAETERIWRAVMAPGIAKMKSSY